ncbi:MAG TPA: hypothetical protein VD884_23595 [Ohtaekwangia sp.]|nr:hypothetical protein [Ohtaekwangia sp.]
MENILFNNRLRCLIFTILMLPFGCSKDNESDPAPIPPSANASCVLASENFGGYLGITGKIVYKYDDKTNLKAVSKINNLGQELKWITVETARAIVDYNDVRTLVNVFAGDDILEWRPTRQETSFQGSDGHIIPIFDEFLFAYNTEKQLAAVIATGPDILFFYDEKGNMNSMRQISDEGIGNDVVYRAKVTYDDKPSPYTALQPMFKFLQHTFRWHSNSNPWLLIASMSKNNPTRIDLGSWRNDLQEFENWSLIFDYTYNEKGYPTQTKVTSIFESGEQNSNYAWNTYTYDCP